MEKVHLMSAPAKDKRSLTPAMARDKAAECLVLAAAADHRAHRVIIESMAKTWERIAETLEEDAEPR